MGVFIVDLLGVNEQSESFETDFIVIQSWRDPRLSEPQRGASLLGCRIDIADIWNPAVEPINQKDLRSDRNTEVQISEEGDVTYVVSYQGQMSSPLNLRNFPFDRQELPIQLATFVYASDEVQLEPNEEWTGMLDNAGLAGWEILDSENDSTLRSVDGVVGRHARLDHLIHVKRNAAFYIWKYTIPLCFIVLMAASVFWLDPETFGHQVHISVGAIMALVAYLIALSNFLPQIDYLTKMDKMVLGSTTLVFLSFGEVAVTSRLVRSKRAVLARRIDWHARWVFGLVFALLLATTMIFV